MSLSPGNSGLPPGPKTDCMLDGLPINVIIARYCSETGSDCICGCSGIGNLHGPPLFCVSVETMAMQARRRLVGLASWCLAGGNVGSAWLAALAARLTSGGWQQTGRRVVAHDMTFFFPPP